MSARTDPHRPGAIIPTDYRRVLWYSLNTAAEGSFLPSVNVDCARDKVHGEACRQANRISRSDIYTCVGGCPPREHAEGLECCVAGLRLKGVAWASTGGVGKCSVCGACYVHGEVWRHDQTGEHVHVGHDCSDKYGMYSDRSEWEAWHRQQTKLRAQARREKRFRVAALRFLETRPELSAALDLTGDEASFPIRTLHDMREKLNQYGSLSEKQVAFALRLAAEVTNPAPVVEERHVQAPQGRVHVEGVVVGVKYHESDFGGSYKMTVKVDTEEGSWLVWCTVPSNLVHGQDVRQELHGRVVAFDATLTAGRDPHFAFGKRPTKATVLEGR